MTSLEDWPEIDQTIGGRTFWYEFHPDHVVLFDHEGVCIGTFKSRHGLWVLSDCPGHFDQAWRDTFERVLLRLPIGMLCERAAHVDLRNDLTALERAAQYFANENMARSGKASAEALELCNRLRTMANRLRKKLTAMMVQPQLERRSNESTGSV